MTPATLLRRVLVALALLAVFEFAARQMEWRDPTLAHDPYLGLAGTSPLFRAERDAEGVLHWRRSPNKTMYREAHFLAEKPADEFRVFAIGGSSVRSEAFLHPDASFPRMLEIYLRPLLDGRRPKVINCGGGGMGSSQNLEVLREVLRHAPDLLVVYPEGGEKNLVPPAPQGLLAARDDAAPLRAGARRQLAQLRLYGLVRDAWNGLMPSAPAAAGIPSTFAAFALSIVSQPFREDSFTRLLELKQSRVPPLMPHPVSREVVTAAHARFARNLDTMAALAADAGVPLVFVQPVRNLRASFYLRFHIDPAEILPGREADWRQHYERGMAAKAAGRWQQAVAELEAVRACYAQDTDEILAYALGECREALGQMDRARQEFAQPYLRHPMRAQLEDAARRNGVPLVDPYPRVAAISPQGVPGYDEFTDSFHPQSRTNREIARAIVEGLRETDIGRPHREKVDEGLYWIDQEVMRLVERWPPPAHSRMHKAVLEQRWPDAVEAAAGITPDTLVTEQAIEAVYLGWALTRLSRFEEARHLHGALRRLLWRPNLVVPPLERDEDIITFAYAGDIFAWF